MHFELYKLKFSNTYKFWTWLTLLNIPHVLTLKVCTHPLSTKPNTIFFLKAILKISRADLDVSFVFLYLKHTGFIIFKF